MLLAPRFRILFDRVLRASISVMINMLLKKVRPRIKHLRPAGTEKISYNDLLRRPLAWSRIEAMRPFSLLQPWRELLAFRKRASCRNNVLYCIKVA